VAWTEAFGSSVNQLEDRSRLAGHPHGGKQQGLISSFSPEGNERWHTARAISQYSVPPNYSDVSEPAPTSVEEWLKGLELGDLELMVYLALRSTTAIAVDAILGSVLDSH
jgi:hypothetical protein